MDDAIRTVQRLVFGEAALYGGVLRSPVPYPSSDSFAPSITREAMSTIGTPVTLLIYGTVLDARGLTSMT